MPNEDLDSLTKALVENRIGWRDPSVQSTLETLRADRNFAALAALTEKCARFHPNEPKLRRLQAQALIDSGQPATAVSVIESVKSHLTNDDPELPELQGLLGRAYKQMLIDSGSGRSAEQRDLLERAIAAYRIAYEVDSKRYWHGVNLLALGWRAQRQGLAQGNARKLTELAQQVMATASAAAWDSLDPWALATVAEASIALRDPAATEDALRAFLNAKGLEAFHVGSLLRQLVQVWQLDGKEWLGALTALRAMHMRLPGVDATLMAASDVQQLVAAGAEAKLVYERILSPANGLVPFEWIQLANTRATGVAAVRASDPYGRDSTIGTAFVVDGGSLLDKWKDHTLALTNFHVVNREGVRKGARPDAVELVFEAVDPARRHAICQILWESPEEEFDCAILQLDPPPPTSGVPPMARKLPLKSATPPALVYIIGHPNGRGLEFSMHNNELLDHNHGLSLVTRIHYRAPTEGGSSGSPVFKEGRWEAIAIHHGYTETRLDGNAGGYRANEGIGLASIKARLTAIAATLPP
jgi:hypothetical protein